MKRILLPLLLILFILTGCAQKLDGDGMIGKTTYIQIDQEKAKEMMAVNDGHVIVDVRRADEYLMGHSDISVTMNTYTHLGLEDAAAEMKRLEEVERAREEQERMDGPISRDEDEGMAI